MTPTADPIDDYKDWEGPVNKTVDSKLRYVEQLKASDVTWYYRIISVDNQVGDWVKSVILALPSIPLTAL